jgi:predicted transcriptional regulator
MPYGLLKYRTKADRFAQIFEVSKENPVTKTRIAYDCFLSYDLLSRDVNTNPMMF